MEATLLLEIRNTFLYLHSFQSFENLMICVFCLAFFVLLSMSFGGQLQVHPLSVFREEHIYKMILHFFFCDSFKSHQIFFLLFEVIRMFLNLTPESGCLLLKVLISLANLSDHRAPYCFKFLISHICILFLDFKKEFVNGSYEILT